MASIHSAGIATIMKNILISGNIYEEDLPYVKSREAGSTLSVQTIPFMDSITDIDRLCAEAADADLLIFRLVGQNPLTFVEHCKQTGKLTAFERIACPKVVWSQDSHHMYPFETQAEPYFTRFYVAHGNYIDKYSSNAIWLPCCYTASSIPMLMSLSKTKLNKERELISTYRMYCCSKRNPLLYKIYKIINDRKINNMFCQLYGDTCINSNYGNLLYGLKTSSISLNVPYIDDLNIRNFESIAMNCSLLALETTEHKKIDLDYSHTFFFKRDLSDFTDALEAALEDKFSSKDTWQCIPGKHMLIDRYISIINNELKTDFFVDIQDIDNVEPLKIDNNIKLDNENDIIYSAEFLSAHSILSLLNEDRLNNALQQFAQDKRNLDIAKVIQVIISLIDKINNTKIYCGLIAVFSVHGFTQEADTILKLACAGEVPKSIMHGIEFYVKNAQQLVSVANYAFQRQVFMASIKGIGILNYENSKISGAYFFLQKLLSGRKKPTVIDIGANIGTYALDVRKISNDACIYAFEPNPVAFAALKKEAKKYNFFAFQLGISDSEKESILYDRKDMSGSAHASRYKQVITDIHKQDVERIPAKFTTLDFFLKTQNFESIDLVKIDTEGHELAVLNGAIESIHRRIIQAFQIEFNEMNIIAGTSFYKLKRALPGYSWYRLLPDGMIPIDNESILLQELYAFQNLVAILN
ncbi:MAG: FkbM family methyltransferase [Desulfovibrio sp.]|nr:FkbM family methyltransferase [Desulfovibrio sp.]